MTYKPDPICRREYVADILSKNRKIKEMIVALEASENDHVIENMLRDLSIDRSIEVDETAGRNSKVSSTVAPSGPRQNLASTATLPPSATDRQKRLTKVSCQNGDSSDDIIHIQDEILENAKEIVLNVKTEARPLDSRPPLKKRRRIAKKTEVLPNRKLHLLQKVENVRIQIFNDKLIVYDGSQYVEIFNLDTFQIETKNFSHLVSHLRKVLPNVFCVVNYDPEKGTLAVVSYDRKGQRIDRVILDGRSDVRFDTLCDDEKISLRNLGKEVLAISASGWVHKLEYNPYVHLNQKFQAHSTPVESIICARADEDFIISMGVSASQSSIKIWKRNYDPRYYKGHDTKLMGEI